MLHCCCFIVMVLKHASIALTASYWVFAYPKINDEKIQRRATKLVISLRKLPWKERLLRLNLHTLEYRRLRGDRDMIKVYKIVHNVYNNRVAPSLSYYKTSVTRGNKFKLQNQSFNNNLRKTFFSARTVNIWNSLPNYVVDVQSIDLMYLKCD